MPLALTTPLDAPHRQLAGGGVRTGRRSILRFRWLTRPRRLVITLVGVWLLSFFDLGFTLQEYTGKDFVEMNPIAARVLGHSPMAIAAYKFGLVGFGSVILLWLRKYSVAELGAWFLLAVNTYVAIRWYVYFECTTTGAHNVFIASPH